MTKGNDIRRYKDYLSSESTFSLRDGGVCHLQRCVIRKLQSCTCTVRCSMKTVKYVLYWRICFSAVILFHMMPVSQILKMYTHIYFQTA